MNREPFFSSSKRLLTELTEIFDFIWPTAAALWNLRWQVKGYADTRPSAGPIELTNRFVIGSGIHGANLKKACIESSWEQQQHQFAKFVLTNVIALYEGWAQNIIDELNSTNSSHPKMLQFPDSGRNNGIESVIRDVVHQKSIFLSSEVYPQYATHKKFSISKLPNLIKCYRYFKECRNCLAHNGGISNSNLSNSYLAFLAVATPSDLGLKEVPIHFPMSLGTDVIISLRGVVGLCDVIMRIVITCDAEFIKSILTEKVFQKYWKDKFKKQLYTLKPGDPNKRSVQIKRFFNKIKINVGNTTTEAEKFLVKNRLVSR